MLSLNEQKNILEGELKLSDAEKYIVKWLGTSTQASFYIGDKQSVKDDIDEFIHGNQVCKIDVNKYLKYLKKIQNIVVRYSALYHDPIDIIQSVIDRFSNYDGKYFEVILSYITGDRYLRILNDKKDYTTNRALYGDVVLKNGTYLRNSFVGGITKISIKKENESYYMELNILNNWRDIIMQKSNKLTLEKIVNIFNEEMEINTNNGYSEYEAAQLFGIKFNPLIENNGDEFTYEEIVESSNYNSDEILDAVQAGMALSPAVLWEKDDVNSNDNLNDLLASHNVYGIHIKKKNDALSNENPHICIGWSAIGNLQECENKEDIANKYENTWPGKPKKAKGQDVGQLYRFVFEAQIGDYVIYAENEKRIHIGIITSDYTYNDVAYPEQDADYVNIRKVNWLLKDIDRKILSKAFRSSLATSMSFFRLNDYKSVVQELLEGTYEEELDDNKEDDEPAFESALNSRYPKNFILYGAPGTGKTYSTANYANSIIEDVDYNPSVDRNEVMEKYRQYVDDGRIVFTTFHQNYSYEDFIQGLRPSTENNQMNFVPVDGIFKRIADEAIKNYPNKYVLIIDEINRANISKVLGELITLLEEDKRWGELNQLSISLPSGDEFKVPNNLYIVGTMNSADKSISMIDVALRRRFEFFEVQVDYNKISNNDLRKVLKNINSKLVDDLDSTDLLVGHAYFMNKTIEQLDGIMNNNIIPLLYEYYFDNSKKVKEIVAGAIEETNYEIDSKSQGRIKIIKKADTSA